MATAFLLTALAHMAAVVGPPAAATAALVLIAASAAATLFRNKRVGTAALAVALASMAGALGWPASSLHSWLVSAASWLVLTFLADSTRPSRNPVGAITLRTGIAVFARERAGAAWVDSSGEVRSASARRPAGVLAILLRQVLASFPHRGAAVSFRRLHGAEHIVVTAAWAGIPPDPDRIHHATKHCGGTISAAVVLTALAALLVAPSGIHPAVIVAWSTAAGVSLREAAISSRWLSFVLIPGLWLQKLTTARPGPLEMEVALAALRAATESTSSKSG